MPWSWTDMHVYLPAVWSWEIFVEISFMKLRIIFTSSHVKWLTAFVLSKKMFRPFFSCLSKWKNKTTRRLQHLSFSSLSLFFLREASIKISCQHGYCSLSQLSLKLHTKNKTAVCSDWKNGRFGLQHWSEERRTILLCYWQFYQCRGATFASIQSPIVQTPCDAFTSSVATT